MLWVLEYLESGKGSARQPEGVGVILVEAGGKCARMVGSEGLSSGGMREDREAV